MKAVIFDSGAGGLPVLYALNKQYPRADFVYLSDRAHLPYGSKTDGEISEYVCERLSAVSDADLIVLACNTATAVAGGAVRSAFSVPVYGIEPAVKPALAASDREVTVLCTPATYRAKQWSNPRLRILTIPTLASDVEKALARGGDLDGLARRVGYLCDTDVVLGCTHYSYLAQGLRAYGHRTYDGAEGLIRHVSQAMRDEGFGSLVFYDRRDADLYGLTIDKQEGIRVY